MALKIQLRYQKKDRYENPVFIANARTEKESYAKLKEIHTKLVAMDVGTYLPVYSTNKYATMRLNSRNAKFDEKATYMLTVNIKKVTAKDGRSFINVYLNDHELISPAPSLGEDLVF
jgi:hypothetical protein